MLEAILDTARQLRRSIKLPQPRRGYRKPKNWSLLKIKKLLKGGERQDGEYAAEQPQGLPAVIAELTRWGAQNLELTLKS